MASLPFRLELYNKAHPEAGLSVKSMEELLFEFETQAFHGATRDSTFLEPPKIEHRADTVCDVCQLGDTADSNEIIFCDGCDMCVHQKCYPSTALVLPWY